MDQVLLIRVQCLVMQKILNNYEILINKGLVTRLFLKDGTIGKRFLRTANK